MPDGEGGVAKFRVDNTVPAARNKDFLAGFSHMLLVSRKSADWNNSHELAMLQEAMRQHECTPQEVYEAFWKAYSDQYVPASGIEWRHLWKHIEEARKGRDRRLYSYHEMLDIVDRENITTAHFERVVEEVERQAAEFPEKTPAELQVWRRK